MVIMINSMVIVFILGGLFGIALLAVLLNASIELLSIIAKNLIEIKYLLKRYYADRK